MSTAKRAYRIFLVASLFGHTMCADQRDFDLRLDEEYLADIHKPHRFEKARVETLSVFRSN